MSAAYAYGKVSRAVHVLAISDARIKPRLLAAWNAALSHVNELDLPEGIRGSWLEIRAQFLRRAKPDGRGGSLVSFHNERGSKLERLAEQILNLQLQLAHHL